MQVESMVGLACPTRDALPEVRIEPSYSPQRVHRKQMTGVHHCLEERQRISIMSAIIFTGPIHLHDFAFQGIIDNYDGWRDHDGPLVVA